MFKYQNEAQVFLYRCISEGRLACYMPDKAASERGSALFTAVTGETSTLCLCFKTSPAG